MRVSIIALLAGSGLLVSACSPPMDDPKAPPAEAAAAQPATAPSGSVEAKPAVSAEKEEQSGPEAAEGVAKERELFTVEHPWLPKLLMGVAVAVGVALTALGVVALGAAVAFAGPFIVAGAKIMAVTAVVVGASRR